MYVGTEDLSSAAREDVHSPPMDEPSIATEQMSSGAAEEMPYLAAQTYFSWNRGGDVSLACKIS